MDEKPPFETTTLWDYPKQSYGRTPKGDNKFQGVTPAFLIWNLLQRYTQPGDLVVIRWPAVGQLLMCARKRIDGS